MTGELVAPKRPGPAKHCQPARYALPRAERGTGRKQRYRAAQRLGVARCDEKSSPSVLHQVKRAPSGRRDDRQAARRCLLQGVAERLVRSAVDEDIEAGVDPPELVALPLAEEMSRRQGAPHGDL